MVMSAMYLRHHPYCIENRMLRYYGCCENYSLATWLLADGTLLNGSCEGHQRDVDHAEAGYYFKKAQGKEAVKKMLRRGNIRVMCQDDSGYLFQVTRKPTSEQKAVIRKAREQADELGIPFLVCRPTKQLFMGKAIESLM